MIYVTRGRCLRRVKFLIRGVIAGVIHKLVCHVAINNPFVQY
jgi:hypothetical protein